MLEELGVNLTGKIAISRYGKIYRGNRLKNCEDAGAIGISLKLEKLLLILKIII